VRGTPTLARRIAGFFARAGRPDDAHPRGGPAGDVHPQAASRAAVPGGGQPVGELPDGEAD
jgi:hypothetical protein